MPGILDWKPVYHRKHGSRERRLRWMDRFVAKLTRPPPGRTRFYIPVRVYTGRARVWCVYNGGTNSLSRAPPTPFSPTRLVNGGWMDRMWLLHSPPLLSEQQEIRHFAPRIAWSPLIRPFPPPSCSFILLNVDLIIMEGEG